MEIPSLPMQLKVSDDDKPLLTLIPLLKEELVEPLFCGYLKRATAIMASVDLTAAQLPPLTDDVTELDQSIQLKLANAAQVLLELHNNASVPLKQRLLDAVARNRMFVSLSLKLNCKSLELYGNSWMPFWMGPATGFIGLIVWSLAVSTDIKEQLKHQGHLVKIIEHVRDIPLETIQGLSETNMLTQAVWLNFRILYQCGESATVTALYNEHNCSQVLVPYMNAPDVELRLISMALIAQLTFLSGDKMYTELLTLGSNETLKLVKMLKTDLEEPFSYHGVSFQVLFKMIKELIRFPRNAQALIEEGILSVLAELAEGLPTTEQEAATELIWVLMQNESNNDAIIVPDSTDTGLAVASKQSPKLGSMPFADVTSQTSDHEDGEIGEVTLQEDEAAIDITELFLRYVIRSFLPCDGLLIQEGANELADVWPTIGVGIVLTSALLKQSSDQLQAEIVRSVAALPGVCRALALAFNIAISFDEAELPKRVIFSVLNDLLNNLMIWTDHSKAMAHEVAKSGFVHTLTVCLHAGNLSNTFDKRFSRSLCTLLNCSYDPSNYPAFFFAESLPELLQLVHLKVNPDITSTIKFILCCLGPHLDCDQLLAIKLEEREAEYCISTLVAGASAPSLKADGFSVHEILCILSNFTQSYSTLKMAANTVQAEFSRFEQRMCKTADELEKNCKVLMKQKLLDTIAFLLLVPEENIQEASARLLWNLLHFKAFKEKVLLEFPAIVKALNTLRDVPSPDIQLTAFCALWVLGLVDDDDISGNIRYAQGCYKYGNYDEAASICTDIIRSNPDEKTEHNHQAKQLKGKAVFQAYQRKMFYLMENRNKIDRAEGKKIQEECFGRMKEVIGLLGTALDQLYLDEEGSRILDWTMMDCIRETNRLNLCHRCLLCRQLVHKELRRSHIWPKFLLRDAKLEMERKGKISGGIKPFMFGQDKYRMKSEGECWYWMLCQRCEEITCQNAENEFCQQFKCSGEIVYSSWLFNYCCTIIFRTLAFVKFPRSFNDDEVYRAFLFCRKHLLSLPVKMDKQEVMLTDTERRQLEMFSQNVTHTLEPFIFITPTDITIETEHGSQQSLQSAISWLAPHQLVDGRKDLSGHSHFFVAHCVNVNIVLRFHSSVACPLPKECQILPQSGTYTIPSDSEKTKLIPKGLWVLHHRSALSDVESITSFFRNLAPSAAQKFANVLFPSMQTSSDKSLSNQTSTVENTSETLGIQPSDSEPTGILSSNLPSIQFRSAPNMPQLSFVPPEFQITKPLRHSLIGRCIKLPEGHQIILHYVVENPQDSLSCFLAVTGESDTSLVGQPYIIYLFSDARTGVHLDAAFIAETNGECHLTCFLLDNPLLSAIRAHDSRQEQIVTKLIPHMLQENGFVNLQTFMHHVKCRRAIGGADDLPSLGQKCSLEKCWYCRDLCHCCMKPTFSWSQGTEFPNIPYRFCSKKCLGMFYFHPARLPKRIFVTDYRDKVGMRKGPSVLDVLRIERVEGSSYNTVHYINLCLGDGSDGIPLGVPYILWQIRHIDTQAYMNFLITLDCTPLELLWTSIQDPDGVADLLEASFKLQPVLESLINLAVKALGCENLQAYLSVFWPKPTDQEPTKPDSTLGVAADTDQEPTQPDSTLGVAADTDQEPTQPDSTLGVAADTDQEPTKPDGTLGVAADTPALTDTSSD